MRAIMSANTVSLFQHGILLQMPLLALKTHGAAIWGMRLKLSIYEQ